MNTTLDLCLDVDWIDERTFTTCNTQGSINVMRVGTITPLRTLKYIYCHRHLLGVPPLIQSKIEVTDGVSTRFDLMNTITSLPPAQTTARLESGTSFLNILTTALRQA